MSDNLIVCLTIWAVCFAATLAVAHYRLNKTEV